MLVLEAPFYVGTRGSLFRLVLEAPFYVGTRGCFMLVLEAPFLGWY